MASQKPLTCYGSTAGSRGYMLWVRPGGQRIICDVYRVQLMNQEVARIPVQLVAGEVNPIRR